MRTYELTYIVPGEFEEKEIPKVTEKVKKLLSDGKIIKEKFWGKRKLAYPIKKNDWGFYITVVLETEPENIKKIESKLKLEEDVIRHLIISTKPAQKPEVKEIEKPKRLEKPEVKAKAKPKKEEKPKKTKITEEIETEEKKMKALEEKLEEILKE